MDRLKRYLFWFGFFSNAAGLVFLAGAVGFLRFALNSASDVASVTGFLAAGFIALNGIALVINGVYHWYVAKTL